MEIRLLAKTEIIFSVVSNGDEAARAEIVDSAAGLCLSVDWNEAVPDVSTSRDEPDVGIPVLLFSMVLVSCSFSVVADVCKGSRAIVEDKTLEDLKSAMVFDDVSTSEVFAIGFDVSGGRVEMGI